MMETAAKSTSFWWRLFTVTTGVALVQCNQETVNYIANNLNVRYDVVSNFISNGITYEARITLTNTGTERVPDHSQPWQMYFCHVRLIDPFNIQNGGTDLGTSGLKVFHVNGCLHRIETTPSFDGIAPDASVELPFESESWLISETDVMPNWYITAQDAQPRVVASTAGESLDHVGHFDTPQKWKRMTTDTYDPYNGTYRFELRNYQDKGSSQAPVLPTPVEENLNAELTVNIGTGDWVVVAGQDQVRPEADYLAKKLDTFVVPPGLTPPSSRFIAVGLNTTQSTRAEYYNLNIHYPSESISIQGTDKAGTFYGIQSLLSLQDYSTDIPSGHIKDYPRFPYRGMHIDVARNFHSLEDIERLLNVMVMYKLNKLHLHLTDDEGWRLQIPDLPELTDVGARRCHDLTGDLCILPQLGSGPLHANDGSGYFSVDEYRRILTLANSLHIQVIPEFDMPGHAHAAINAMLARYREYENSDPELATEYLLSDLEDQSKYLSTQYFTDNAINPCVNSTYSFVHKVIKEVKAMHADIQPLETFHFGGDEVPGGAWINSSACRNMGLESSEKIKQHFMVGISEIAASEGLDLSGWEDGYTKNATELYDISLFPNTNVYSNIWNNVWEWGNGKRAYMFANGDYKVILSHATHLYFDHPQEPDPEERGYYWATRMATARKTFGYMPDSVYDNIDIDRMGNQLDKDQVCLDYGCTALDPDKRNNVIGMQGHLWSETQRKSSQLDYMIYPRLLALAERAWHKAAWEGVSDPADRETQRTQDWERFANTLGYKELSRLDELGVMYAVSPPGARVSPENVIEIRAEYPGLPVQFSNDGGDTWSDFSPGRVLETGTVHVVTRSANRGRVSRPSILEVQPLVSSGNYVSVHIICGIIMLLIGTRCV